MKTIQMKSDRMAGQSALKVEGKEGTSWRTDIPSTVANLTQSKSIAPDPEVIEKKPRRRFTATYKLRILREYDACTRPGEVGGLLRRERYNRKLCLRV